LAKNNNLPDVILIGQPNSGKSTLFNAVAGLKAETSNFPGTTVKHTHSRVNIEGNVINIIDPDVIVLGGGMSNIMRLYENVPRRWAEYVFSDRVDTRLVAPKHGDSSGVRGAAWLWE